MTNFSSTVIMLAGDLNTLSDAAICSMGLSNNVTQPTHNENYLDRLYTSEPVYATVKVVTTAIKTAHKAIIAC